MDLKSTISLPKTSFKMKANLPQKEPQTLEWWESINVYGKIREAHAGDPTFVFHDGPPYANGNIHLGQALNKTLKDFVVKSRSMMGRDARYVPGWDCHGLPIEHRVDKELGAKKAGMHPLHVRERCRRYALKFIKVQRKEFRRLGVFWDWTLDAEEEKHDAPNRTAIYRTLDRSYEAEVIRQMGRFFTNGSIYHGVKPVHWCWSCKTALAEAEVEHADRTDPSIYVRLPVANTASRIPELDGLNVAVLIWTTTPWTLPANLAVALHAQLDYVAVRRGDAAWIVAAGLLAAVSDACGWDEPEVLARFKGAQLVGEGDDWVGEALPVDRPYLAPSGAAARPGVLILGNHVTLEAGTGCVHTAPGHGADDFNVGQRYGLDVFNPVDDAGRFAADKVNEEWLAGEFVLDANQAILADLDKRGWLVHSADCRHSYPHCWRCKNPVLFRSTPQWFVSMDATGLRQKALEQIRKTHWTPSFGEARIAQMIETRPDWCISRQRSWGVPVPIAVCGACFDEHDDAFVRDEALFAHIARIFGQEGSNAWYGVPNKDGEHRPYTSDAERRERLIPAGVVCPRCHTRDHLVLQDHIVDVWFESGASHGAVLGHDEGLPWPADLYLEGHDQYRGWFHSSLLVAVNDRERAPYRAVLTHGFTVDSDGRKMSKSLGNYVSPLELADKRGAEILRLWVSMVDFLEDMRVSEETWDRNAETYRKVRNTFRYLLGNLHEFDPVADRVPYAEMEEIDRWAVQQLEQLRQRLLQAYDRYQYHFVYHGLHHFATVTLSSFYFDILKDRLYTFPAKSPARRSAQTALWLLADGLCRLMAPILCFTAEEIWQRLEALRGNEPWTTHSVHATNFPESPVEQPDRALLDRWERLGQIRAEVNKALELARAAKTIGTSLEACVTLETPDDDTAEFLRSFGDGLRFLLITSGVELGAAGEGAFRSETIEGLVVNVRRAAGDKCERCWHYTEDVGGDGTWPTICARCVENVRTIIEQERA